MALEARRIEHHRVPVEQGFMAAPASPARSVMIGEPLARDPVDRVAMRTDDVNGRIHLVLLVCGAPADSLSGFLRAECNRQTPAGAARLRIAGDPATRSCNLGPQTGHCLPVREETPCN
jgi:hypothetical protein